MTRRILSILLVILILVQNAPMHHAHAGTGIGEPSDHDQRPHFHLPMWWVFNWHHHENEERPHHHHGHSHGDGHHHHHHDGDARDEETPPGDDEPIPPTDHDSNTIYFPDVAVVCRLPDGPQLANAFASPLFYYVVDYRAYVQTHSFLVPKAMPPPVMGRYNCPIYLDTLSLLI